MLFAIDKNTNEIIVSESKRGSIKVNLVERISSHNHKILYNAIITLESISQSNNVDLEVFKLMDKICNLIYKKYKAAQ